MFEFPKILGLSAQQKAKIARVFRRRFWVGHRPCYLQLFRNPLENSSTTSACKERVQRAVSGLPCWTRRRAAIIVNNGNADYRCLAFPCRRRRVVGGGVVVVFFALAALLAAPPFFVTFVARYATARRRATSTRTWSGSFLKVHP